MELSRISALQHRHARVVQDRTTVMLLEKQECTYTHSDIEDQYHAIQESFLQEIKTNEASPPPEVILEKLEEFYENDKTLNYLDFTASLLLFFRTLKKCKVEKLPLPLPEISKFLALSFLKEGQLVQEILAFGLDISLPGILTILKKKDFIIVMKRIRRVSNLSSKSLNLDALNLLNLHTVLDRLVFSFAQILEILPSILKCLTFYESEKENFSILSSMLLSLIEGHEAQFELLPATFQTQIEQAIYNSEISSFPKPLIQFVVSYARFFPDTALEDPHIFTNLTLAFLSTPSCQIYSLLLQFCSIIISSVEEREEIQERGFNDLLGLIQISMNQSSLFDKQLLNFIMVMISFGLFHESTSEIEKLNEAELDLIQWFLVRRLFSLQTAPSSQTQLDISKCLLDCILDLLKLKEAKNGAVIQEFICYSNMSKRMDLIKWSETWHNGALKDFIQELLNQVDSMKFTADSEEEIKEEETSFDSIAI